MTQTIEHSIFSGNILPKFRDALTLPSALNLTGATFQFRYQKNGATIERAAILVSNSAKPSISAATSFDLEFSPIILDTDEIGRFAYQWRVNIPGETAPLDIPSDVSPESDGTARQFLRFAVLKTV